MTDGTDVPKIHTILVIDNEPEIRGLRRLALEEAGYAVRKSHEGSHGLAIAKQEGCSPAMVDLFMPGKEGLETILALRRERPLMNLIAMSGGSSPTDMLTMAASLGADITIHKPFNIDTLLTSIGTRSVNSEAYSMNGTAGVHAEKKGMTWSYGL